MEPDIYRVRRIEDGQRIGYRLEGPGIQVERTFRSEESRERLQDIADLMNFAFERGRQLVEANQQASSSKD